MPQILISEKHEIQRLPVEFAAHECNTVLDSQYVECIILDGLNRETIELVDFESIVGIAGKTNFRPRLRLVDIRVGIPVAMNIVVVVVVVAFDPNGH